MFSTVVGTFLRFLAWYAIIIVAFGIAFYIMFHQDHAGAELNADYPFFDTLALALFKTSAMFVGELEFADLPIQQASLLKYINFNSTICSDGSQLLRLCTQQIKCCSQDPLHGVPGYLFLLFFVFIIVVVLMNLLNGLAVSDTGPKPKTVTLTHTALEKF